MHIGLIATMICALAGQPEIDDGARSAPERNTRYGLPELGAAVVVDSRTIETHRFVESMVKSRVAVNEPTFLRPGEVAPKYRTEVVPLVSEMIERVDITKIAARRVDGRAVTYKELVRGLAKEAPVIFVKQGEKVDPRFTKLFRPASLVLVLPSFKTPRYVAGGISPMPAAKPTRQKSHRGRDGAK